MPHAEQRERELSRAVACDLRAVAARRQVTLSALSRATGIPRTTLSRKLRGHGDLTVSELVRLAVALDVSAADLLARD